MAQTNRIAATLAMGIALAASSPAAAQDRLARNPSINSVHQPVVQRTDFVLDLGAANGVPQAELYRLADWFDTLRLGYGDRIYVDGGYSDQRARQDVAGVAAEYGLLLSDGAPLSAGAVQPGTVRVIVSRSTASVPGCPNWQDAGDVGMRITTATNFGCATNSNLAAMVADPADLVLGQYGSRATDTATATKAVDAYRRRVPTGYSGEVKSESAKGGK